MHPTCLLLALVLVRVSKHSVPGSESHSPDFKESKTLVNFTLENTNLEKQVKALRVGTKLLC